MLRCKIATGWKEHHQIDGINGKLESVLLNRRLVTQF